VERIGLRRVITLMESGIKDPKLDPSQALPLPLQNASLSLSFPARVKRSRSSNFAIFPYAETAFYLVGLEPKELARSEMIRDEDVIMTHTWLRTCSFCRRSLARDIVIRLNPRILCWPSSYPPHHELLKEN
jgi:hypothetical protein